ncbi:hypothetical protein [Jiella pelagia]|uniref:Uncharacterized protein n=1 Tax=Jiella pelagia TaxID=2986949 RepID=A0ABY7BX39_9HYPH|nr:hypothetical protein [Jiella pelagia]WAP68079.1 hypothetical protein OH818_22230 [Jiella pelagia]
MRRWILGSVLHPKTAFSGWAVTAVVASVGILTSAPVLLTSASEGSAQEGGGNTNITVSGDSNEIDNSRTEISGNDFIILSETLIEPDDGVSSEVARKIIQSIQSGIESGDIQITRSGAKGLINDVDEILSSTLIRNQIDHRQFDLSENQSKSILGTSNIITFRAICGQGNIQIVFNEDFHNCVNPGYRMYFTISGKNYFVNYDGRQGSVARFTIYPTT